MGFVLHHSVDMLFSGFLGMDSEGLVYGCGQPGIFPGTHDVPVGKVLIS